MRLLLPLLLIAFLVPTLSAQNAPLRKFIRKYNNGTENVSITVPGFLIGLAGEIGLLASDTDEDRALFHLVQEVGTTRLLTFNTDDFRHASRDLTDLLQTLETENGYERWATVRSAEGERIELTVRMRNKTIHDLVAVISTPDDGRTHLVHARTDLSAQELADVVKVIEDGH